MSINIGAYAFLNKLHPCEAFRQRLDFQYDWPVPPEILTMDACNCIDIIARRLESLEAQVTGQSQALVARYHLGYFPGRRSPLGPTQHRKLPSSSLAMAATEALIEFLEIAVSTLTFAKPPKPLVA